MERYVVVLLLANGQQREIDVRANRAEAAARTALIVHGHDHPVPAKSVEGIRVSGVRG